MDGWGHSYTEPITKEKLEIPGMKHFTILLLLNIILLPVQGIYSAEKDEDRRIPMIDIPTTVERLKAHLHELTKNIGERSVRLPENLAKTAAYIHDFYRVDA
ncbi:hypothetical protein D1AOALGA4SA_5026 [Olavius algarvensis Delta 1 endosymbiont]|nr:hypothetical protein D1AOALGA4SA_5026 [Olavius algarvensis Delta 1 endosymbiont]